MTIRLVQRCVFETARLYRVHPTIPVCIIVVLRSGRYVEMVKTPKHRPFYRSHDGSFANRLRVDVEWNSDRVRQ